MKLKNKKTGEIVDLSEGFIKDTYNGEKIQIKPVAISNKEGYVYGSLAELNEEWEDVPEEPQGYWYISEQGIPGRINFSWDSKESIENHKEIGNYFETYEEAEKAVEKLQAWKRLKDNGFKFKGLEKRGRYINFYQGKSYETDRQCQQAMQDLDLLFGGEE